MDQPIQRNSLEFHKEAPRSHVTVYVRRLVNIYCEFFDPIRDYIENAPLYTIYRPPRKENLCFLSIYPG